mgnify:CR=1 FL=1
MKSWQHGYELAHLQAIVTAYTTYNAFCYSPFAEVNKRTVADLLHQGTLTYLNDKTFLNVSPVKTKGTITMHGDTVIGYKQRGDLMITRLTGDLTLLSKHLTSLNENCWVYVWAEDSAMVSMVESCGFCRVGVKVTSFSEIHAVYFRAKYQSAMESYETREFPIVSSSELFAVKRLPFAVNQTLLESICRKAEALSSTFTNHYSNYNKKNAWSALSLRGYTADPTFITKPEEMNDKWKVEHQHEDFMLQDTPLFDSFPEVRELLTCVPGDYHRIRLMRLAPGQGELERHTDQVDPDAGSTIGKLARLHFPLKTNPDVIFTNWDASATPIQSHMSVGECWYLDTRKPHKAINGGQEERIHLVVDVVTTESLHHLLCDTHV